MPLTDLPPPEESLAVIAASYKSIAASTEGLWAVSRSLDATTQRLEATQTFALRLQTCAMALIGISLVGLGGLWWYSATQHAQIAAILRQMTH